MPTSAGLVDFVFHPPLGVLTPHVETSGPFTGEQTFTSLNGRPVTDTYGVVLVAAIIPPNLGRIPGWSGVTAGEDADTYRDRLFQLVVEHQLFGGAWVQTQVVNCFETSKLILWDVAAPGKLGLYCLPGVSVDIYYLLAL